MSTNQSRQDQSVPKIICTTDDVEALIASTGYKTVTFLDTCGVKYNTFQHWKRMRTIPNDSALILFNLINSNPAIFTSIRLLIANLLIETDIDND